MNNELLYVLLNMLDVHQKHVLLDWLYQEENLPFNKAQDILCDEIYKSLSLEENDE